MSSEIKKYSCVIVEDEFLATLRLRSLLSKHANTIQIVGSASTVQAAIELINNSNPDLIFLDIQLPDGSGFDVLEKISHRSQVVFTTAYSEYAVQAFTAHALDYLVKPIEQDRFDQSISKLESQDMNPSIGLEALKNMLHSADEKKSLSSLAIKKKDKIILLAFEDVVYFSAEDKYLNAHTQDGKTHLMSKSLTELEKELPSQFIRVQRSYIVNRSFVSEIHKHFKGKYILQLSDKNANKIQTGSSYQEVVKSSFGL